MNREKLIKKNLQEKDRVAKEKVEEPSPEPSPEPVTHTPAPIKQPEIFRQAEVAKQSEVVQQPEVVKTPPVQATEVDSTAASRMSEEVKQPNLPDVTLVGEPKDEKEEVSKK